MLTARFDVRHSGFQFQADLSVPVQGTIAVFGPSGSGKTTFLRCLAGLERSPSGFLKIDKEIWQDEAHGTFVPVHRRGIGLVFQEGRLFPHLTVRRNLEYGGRRTNHRGNGVSFKQVVELLELADLLGKWPLQLSGGEIQRVAIGRALLANPRLLLMDEPLASLDLARKREILPFIQRVQQECRIPMVYVSHAINEILQLATTLVVIRNGRIAAAGPIQEIFGRLDIPDVLEPSIVGAVLETRVAEHEPDFGLTKVDLCGHSLFVPQQNLQPGTPLRLHVLSRDVSIVTKPFAGSTSVLNILEAIVIAIGDVGHDRHAVEVKLDVGCPLLATITKKSLNHLALKPGQRVYAHIKAVALMHD